MIDRGVVVRVDAHDVEDVACPASRLRRTAQHPLRSPVVDLEDERTDPLGPIGGQCASGVVDAEVEHLHGLLDTLPVGRSQGLPLEEAGDGLMAHPGMGRHRVDGGSLAAPRGVPGWLGHVASSGRGPSCDPDETLPLTFGSVTPFRGFLSAEPAARLFIWLVIDLALSSPGWAGGRCCRAWVFVRRVCWWMVWHRQDSASILLLVLGPPANARDQRRGRRCWISPTVSPHSWGATRPVPGHSAASSLVGGSSTCWIRVMVHRRRSSTR